MNVVIAIIVFIVMLLVYYLQVIRPATRTKIAFEKFELFSETLDKFPPTQNLLEDYNAFKNYYDHGKKAKININFDGLLSYYFQMRNIVTSDNDKKGLESIIEQLKALKKMKTK